MNNRVVIVLLTAVLAGGCTTSSEVWETRNNPNVDYVVTKENADFGQYTQISLLPFEIYYPTEGQQPDPAELAQIRSIFRKAFFDAVGGKYLIVSSKAPNVLAIRALLVDLRTLETGRPPHLGRLSKYVSPGNLTLMVEWSDSETGEVLMHAADEEDLAAAEQYLGADSSVAAINEAAERWAKLIRAGLDNNLNK